MEGLLERYRQPLQKLLHLRRRRQLDSRSLLETQDLVQEVMTRALVRLPSFEYRGIGSFWAYLRQVALNHVHEVGRRTRRGHSFVPISEEVDADSPGRIESPLAEISLREEYGSFSSALAALPRQQAEALLMRLELELSYNVIATECGFPSAAAARMAVVRAIRQVCREMGRDGFKP